MNRARPRPFAKPRGSASAPRCARHATIYVGSPPMCQDCKREALVAQAKSRKEHASDCAVHNEPAFPAGPCNCEGV